VKPLVSILIPAYNASQWLATTVRSAIGQTWDHKEIVIVDDGSTDDTFAIARSFESDAIRVYTQKNQGAAATRNHAFEFSKGDYIQWLDADDLIGPDKVASQVAIAQQCQDKRILISGGWANFLYRHEHVNFVPTLLWADLTPTEWLTRKMAHNLHMQTATWLVSRELTEAAGPWNTALLGDDDGEYFCRVLLASKGVRFAPAAKVYYRDVPNSLSYIGLSNRKIDAHWHSMKLHMNYLRSLEDSDRTRAACVTYMQNWLGHFYPERLDIVNEAQALARSFGGELQTPRLSWKYSWIDAIFGRALAKRAQIVMPRLRWSAVRWWDKTLFKIENRKRVPNLEMSSSAHI
jgi:glycosyltransferase involved in cell wall biosynthesis